MEKELKNCTKVKLIASLLVVLGHVTRMYTEKGIITPMRSSIIMDYLTEYIYSFHMPLFVFLSGFIYFHNRINLLKYEDKNEFIKGKFKRLMVPYFMVGILILTPTMVELRLTSYNYSSYIIKSIFLMGNNRHLWFLTMLFYLFVIIRIFENIISKVSDKEMMILSIIINLIAYILALPLGLSDALYYFIYFYLGKIFLENRQVRKVLKNKKNIIVLLFFNMIFLLLSQISINDTVVNILFLNLMKLGSAISGIFAIYSLIGIINKNLINDKVYNLLNKNSFGLYLFHVSIVYSMFFILKNTNLNPMILTIIIFITSSAFSIFITQFIRKVNLGIMIGEYKKIKTIKSEDLVKDK